MSEESDREEYERQRYEEYCYAEAAAEQDAHNERIKMTEKLAPFFPQLGNDPDAMTAALDHVIREIVDARAQVPPYLEVTPNRSVTHASACLDRAWAVLTDPRFRAQFDAGVRHVEGARMGQLSTFPADTTADLAIFLNQLYAALIDPLAEGGVVTVEERDFPVMLAAAQKIRDDAAAVVNGEGTAMTASEVVAALNFSLHCPAKRGCVIIKVKWLHEAIATIENLQAEKRNNLGIEVEELSAINKKLLS